MLLAVPNVSEGRDAVAVAEIADAFAAGGAELLDIHSDADHNRSVVTLKGEPGALNLDDLMQAPGFSGRMLIRSEPDGSVEQRGRIRIHPRENRNAWRVPSVPNEFHQAK